MITLDVWSDYSCPYAYAAAVWLREVKAHYRETLEIHWRDFPLEQVNSMQGPEWKLWEQPDGHRSKTLWAFRAGQAARLQGDEPFQRFHMALFEARHQRREDLNDLDLLAGIAQECGLDLGRFRRNLGDQALLKRIGQDYEEGTQEHGIWGTPTLVFNGRQAAYLKLRPAPPAGEGVKLFEELFDLVANRPYLLEVKRPR